MDARLAFEEEWLPVDEAEGGSGIDALLGCGMDERRLHRRAHDHWLAARTGNDHPTLDALMETGGEFAPHSLILDFSEDSAVPAIRHVGHRLRATLSSPAGGPLLSRLAGYYPMIAKSGSPVGFEAEFSNGFGGSTLYRGILMPVSGDAQERPLLYGVIHSRDLADNHATLSLAFEVDQALHDANRLYAEDLWNRSSTDEMIADAPRAPQFA